MILDYRIWDEVEKIQFITKFLEENKDKITALELSSNSISPLVAKHLSEKIQHLPYLQYANFNDIFVSRKKDQIPDALKDLMLAILDKPIRILNLSNNAFGLIGVQSIDFFFKNTKNLMELYIENCGLGPEGSQLLANLLMENENKLNLQVLVINGNRLEEKGAFAFSK
jgi:Ran GTPase-activating protein 1